MSPSIRFPAGPRSRFAQPGPRRRFALPAPRPIAFLALVALLTTVSAARAQDLGPADGHDLPPTDIERVAVGDEAPLFALESFDRGAVSLSGFRGDKNVVLVFYRGHW